MIKRVTPDTQPAEFALWQLCQRCHAPAVWADLTYNPTTVIDGQGKVRFFEQPRLDYWCDECATLNPIRVFEWMGER